MQNTLKGRLEETFDERFLVLEQWTGLDAGSAPVDLRDQVKEFISKSIIGKDEFEYYDKEKKYKDHEAITRNELRRSQRLLINRKAL